MSAMPRPSLTPVLWARILARYGELGRPLTDEELRAIVKPAAGSLRVHDSNSHRSEAASA